MDKNQYVDLYRNLGWTIFPVHLYFTEENGIKKKYIKPLCKYSNYFIEPPSSEQYDKWFKERIFYDNQSNIYDNEIYLGLITGKTSGLTVIDVDPRHKGDPAVFDKLDTMKVKTIQGGYHYYFLYCPDLSQTQNSFKDFPGVDVRNDGGFVILPSGNEKYEWINSPNSHLCKIKEVPDFLLKNQKMNDYKDYQAVSTDKKIIQEGERHEWYRNYTWHLLNTYNPQEKDLPFFKEAVLALNNKFQPPEDKKTISEHFDYSVARWKNKGTHIYNTSFISSVNPVEGASQIKKNIYEPKDICDLKNQEDEKNWIWEGFIAKNHITLFSALWKAGKSTFLSHLIKSLQKDDVFPCSIQENLPKFKTKKSRVLILSEESEYLWAERREDLEINERDTAFVICRPLKQKLNYKGWIEMLEIQGVFCKEHKIDLFIIDTISGFWNVNNENDAAEVGGALIALNNIINSDTAVLLVHHFRKSGGEEAVAARGSGALGAYVDVIIDFTRLKGNSDSNERVLKMYSRFKETAKELVVELDFEKEQYFLKETKISNVIKEKNLNEVLLELRNYPEGISIPEFHENWTGKILTLRTMRNYFKELERQDKVFIKGNEMRGKKNTPLWSISANKMTIIQNKGLNKEIIVQNEEDEIFQEVLGEFKAFQDTK